MDTFGTSTSIAQLDSTPREPAARVWSPKQLAAAFDDTGPRIEKPSNSINNTEKFDL